MGDLQPRGEKHLCQGCSNYEEIRLQNNKVYRRCGYIGEEIKRIVTSCSLFSEKTSMSLREMKECALYIEKKKASEGAGFKWQRKDSRDDFIDLKDFS